MAEHPKFSHTVNWLGLPSLCPVLSSNHVWELAVLLELVPPVLLGLWVVRLCSTPAPWLWLIVVCHANISVWGWLLYFISVHSCPQPSIPLSGNVFSTGLVFVTIGTAICLVAALANDQHFPVAKLTVREAKAFLEHLTRSRPSHRLVQDSKPWDQGPGRGHPWTGDRNRAEFPVSAWEDHSRAPDLSPASHGGDMGLKIRLTAAPADTASEADFQRFYEQFSAEQEEHQDVKIITSIQGGRTQIGTGRRCWLHFPTVRSDQTCRVYIYHQTRRSILTDFFLRTAWLFNILAASGLVLAVFMCLNRRTVTYNLVKTYRSFTSPIPEPGLSCAYGPPIPPPMPYLPLIVTSSSPSADLSTIIPSRNWTRNRVTGNPEEIEEEASFEGGEGGGGLPPSYSLLELDKDLPTYAQATQ